MREQAHALSLEHAKVGVPLHVLTGEAIDVARFFERYYEPQLAPKTKEVLRPGLRSVGTDKLPVQTGERIVLLVDQFQAAKSEHQLAAEAPAGVEDVERSRFVLSELTAALEFLFDDGVDDERDVQLARVQQVNDDTSTIDALAAALDDYAGLAESYASELDGLGDFDLALVDEARELARVLERPAHRIRVIQPPLGGAFGGKSEPFDLEFCAAKLALLTGRPVKILYTREEVFYSHRGRHPMRMKYRTGFTRDGRITAVDAKTVLDGGAYSSFGLVTTYYSGQLLCSPYAFGAYRFHSRRAYTNKPACGPKRGHGSVQPRFALEVQLDKAAVALGLDPIELRRRNDMGAGSTTVNEFRIGSNGFLECLARVEQQSGWKERRPALPYGQGLGVAGSTYISGTNYPIYPNEMPQAAVQVCLDRSGRARVFSGANDIGQGSNTMLAVIVGEELGLPLEDVRVLSADTDLCPVDLGAYSSRITLMVGNACLQAALELHKKVCGAVAKRWDVPARRVTLVQRRALDLEDPERHVPLAQAFGWAEEDHGLLGAVGSYNTPKDRHGDYRGGTIGASPAYSFTAHVAEVRVDEETGVVDVQTIWVAHDCGRALSRRIVEGQMEGSAYMGFGEAIMEQHGVDPGHRGVHPGPSLLDYRIPTFLDTPKLRALIVEAPDEQGPYGAKEAGEGPLHPSIPAIANAIYDAIGVRLDELPFTPERVLAALEAKRRRDEAERPLVAQAEE
ncbi:MAG: molybdopterin-dependent oxidoreductase, partial [Myxococcales bacterium]|nr:molybdopterin-dependent oxidoreductase [Myxococcales bacterium]